MAELPLSLGIDIGGTFTDLVVLDHATGKAAIWKESTTPDDPARGAARVQRVVLGAPAARGGAAGGLRGVSARQRARGARAVVVPRGGARGGAPRARAGVPAHGAGGVLVRVGGGGVADLRGAGGAQPARGDAGGGRRWRRGGRRETRRRRASCSRRARWTSSATRRDPRALLESTDEVACCDMTRDSLLQLNCEAETHARTWRLRDFSTSVRTPPTSLCARHLPLCAEALQKVCGACMPASASDLLRHLPAFEHEAAERQHDRLDEVVAERLA
ncbi:MAG: hypothetical protein EBS99_17010 [Betaproteobacteria bacterium]|nr:hypothetical protein [Betaproteobacteria bacterium]